MLPAVWLWVAEPTYNESNYYYYYYNHFMTLYPAGTTQVSWYQKDKPFWILLKQG